MEQAVADKIEPSAQAPGLFDRTVILMLEIGSLGTRAKVASESVEVDADKEMLHISKDILDSPELKTVWKQMGAIRAYVKAKALPSYLKGGFYLVPIPVLEEIDTALLEMKAARERLVEAFILVYPERAAEAREKLGTLFRQSDYPTVERVRAAFTFRIRYLTFSTPSSLKGISKDIFDREREKAEAEMRSAVDDIKLLLRAEMKALVDHMVDRLTPDAEGKSKIFRGSLVANIKDFLGAFDSRNVVDDAQLAALAARAKDLLGGVDAEALRKDEGLKNAVVAGFEQLKAALDPMVAERPKRLINLD